MKILIASATSADARYFPDALAEHEVEVIEGVPNGRREDTEALAVVHGPKIGGEVFDAMPKLKLVVTRSTGYDHIDLAEAEKRGIAIGNVPEYGSTTVAEFTFGLILALTRKIPQAVASTRDGGFSVKGLTGIDLEKKTLGIVGLGKIGRNVARMAKGFAMDVLSYDPYKPDSTPLDELLAEADVVALCCPLTPETRHLIDARTLSLMKEGSYLVNTARGPVVDSAALLEALESGRLAGAALDVLEGEEALQAGESDTHEAVNRTLMSHAKVLVTPHLAFDSEEALVRIRETTVEVLQAFAKGDVLNTVSS